MSSFFNFNDAEKQSGGELIPDGVIVPVVMNIKPGGVGEGGWLTASKSSDAEMLNCELTVCDGPYAKRKIFTNMTVSGGSLNDKGESKGGNITRSTLRAILESARNINPNDMSEDAINKRTISGFGDLNGIVFLMKVGIEKDKTGQYADKNKIKTIITPDMRQYAEGFTKEKPNEQPQQGPAFGGGFAMAQAQTPAFGGNAPAPAPAPAFGGAAQAQAPAFGGSATPPPPVQPSENSNPVPAWAK